MKRSLPACSCRLAAAPVAMAVGLTVAAAAIPACRAPSGAEHEPVAAAREATPPLAPPPQGSTPRAGDERAPERVAAAEPAVSPTTPTEPTPAPDAPSEPSAAPTETAPTETAPTETAPTEPAVAPEPARTKPCRRPGPRTKGPLRELVGLDEAAVRRCLGAPDRTSGSTWHYQWPKGCAYEVTRVVVRFARGTVTRAQADHEITGKHCGSEL